MHCSSQENAYERMITLTHTTAHVPAEGSLKENPRNTHLSQKEFKGLLPSCWIQLVAMPKSRLHQEN